MRRKKRNNGSKQNLAQLFNGRGEMVLDLIQSLTVSASFFSSICAAVLEPDAPERAAISDFGKLLEVLEQAQVFSTEVVKLQTPLFTNDPQAVGAMLVYNEVRTVQDMIPVPLGLAEAFADSPRIFASARIWLNGSIEILELLEEQGW